jgi:hypothetical protein
MSVDFLSRSTPIGFIFAEDIGSRIGDPQVADDGLEVKREDRVRGPSFVVPWVDRARNFCGRS